MLAHIEAGNPLAIAVTLLDGLVLARTAFNHSMNFRSVVLYGRGRAIVDPERKLTALRALTEHVCPGRWADARQPTAKELGATTIVEIDIEDASAKIRQGPPGDAGDELEHPAWAGVLPFETLCAAPIADPRLDTSYPVPDYVRAYRRGPSDVAHHAQRRARTARPVAPSVHAGTGRICVSQVPPTCTDTGSGDAVQDARDRDAATEPERLAGVQPHRRARCG